MSFFKWIASGLSTLIGVVVETVSVAVEAVRSIYDEFVGKGGASKEAAEDASQRRHERLREVNDEIMDLRNRYQSRGTLSDQERRRWNDLREQRNELMEELGQLKEVKAAENIIDNKESMDKVRIDVNTTHLLQFVSFADMLGKKCPACSRPMKLQWPRELTVVTPGNFYWGCTGWYVVQANSRACTHTQRLTYEDYALITDISLPEFSLTAEEFAIIVTDPGTVQVISTRIDDLRSDLARREQRVALATCPVHGEHMVLRKKKNPSGLLDTYFLACPYWLPNNAGCTFIEKLKSGSQLAALLKSETGRGVL